MRSQIRSRRLRFVARFVVISFTANRRPRAIRALSTDGRNVFVSVFLYVCVFLCAPEAHAKARIQRYQEREQDSEALWKTHTPATNVIIYDLLCPDDFVSSRQCTASRCQSVRLAEMCVKARPNYVFLCFILFLGVQSSNTTKPDLIPSALVAGHRYTIKQRTSCLHSEHMRAWSVRIVSGWMATVHRDTSPARRQKQQQIENL